MRYTAFIVLMFVVLAGCHGHGNDGRNFRTLQVHFAAPDNPLRADSALADQYQRDGTVRGLESALP
jgi:hypothetical protein